MFATRTELTYPNPQTVFLPESTVLLIHVNLHHCAHVMGTHSNSIAPTDLDLHVPRDEGDHHADDPT